MNSKIMCALAVAVTCVSASEAYAQSTPDIIAPTAEPAAVAAPAPDAEAPHSPPCCSVPALTAVELEFATDASSRTSKAGEMVGLRLAEPLVIGDHVIAPAGTKAVAEIIQASKAGLMGKAGELTFAARYIEIGETRVPLKRFGYGRSQGSDPSGTLAALNVAAAVAMPIASVALIFVSGGNVDIKTGARAHAVVATETFVPSNPQP